MTLKFHIEYHTNWGEELRVAGSPVELGDNQPGKAMPLHSNDGVHWTGEVGTRVLKAERMEYHYEVYRDGKVVRSEWTGQPRTIIAHNSGHKIYTLVDRWRDVPEDAWFYSSAFTETILAHAERDALPPSLKTGFVFHILAPTVGPDQQLYLCGSAPELGSWNPDRAVPLCDTLFPAWLANLDIARPADGRLEYKFLVKEKATGRLVTWEEGYNRRYEGPWPMAYESIVVDEGMLALPRAEWRGAGVAVPIFSLRSEHSWGVGDFGDLRRLIDWAVRTHQRVVQILPINDTTMTHTWTDSYPYNSISIYAFHPMYLDLNQLGPIKDAEAAALLEQRRLEINALPQVDYEEVNRLKWAYIRIAFAEQWRKVQQLSGFRRFLRANKGWLRPYAVFSYLRDAYGTPDFRQWPQYRKFSAEDVDALCSSGNPSYKEIAIYFYVQYNLHLQLLAATQHAREHGVVLKGDIPIGISRNSVEAWTEPYYFNMNGQAGAPPDDFSVNGQNWGFPTYNWDVMAHDGYAWWMKRFQKMSEYFDAYRIDHILGFFRIWEIPMHSVHGLLGQFSPALPMSREEIESYGLRWNEQRFTQPYIHDWFLGELFGEQTDYVKQTFLERISADGEYRLRSNFDTQRKVEAWFATKTDPDSIRLRDGIYSLISDVLFVPDRTDPHQYHPRISVINDYVYRSLSDAEKGAFYHLYVQYYYHRHNDFWREKAMQKLPRLTGSTRMLVCGEDLGMIPSCVPSVINELRILSLEIQSMPKDPKQAFGIPAQYPYRSVCTISTHDTSTLRGWWEENREQTQLYYNTVLGHSGEAPASASPEICEEIVTQHLHGRSMLCILSLQDWTSIDGALRLPDVQAERINVPANPRHYWRYRMHLTLEQLLAADGLNDKICRLIDGAGRHD